MAVLIRDTKCSKDLHSKQKRKRHAKPFGKGGRHKREE